MTVAAVWVSGVGSQQSGEIAFQYYDKVAVEVTGALEAALGNNGL